jgi:ankyrin repeat protein
VRKDAPTTQDLIAAVLDGDSVKVAAILATAPALAQQANMFGAKAVHAAFHGGHRTLLAMLFEAGAVNDGFLAAELGDVQRLSEEIGRRPDFVSRLNPGGMTALHLACYWGALEAARLLIDAGADVNAASRDFFLIIHPLGSAVATPDIPNPSYDEDRVLALVDLLLDRGADVNARRRDGLTALHTAAYRGHLRAITRLIERGADASLAGHDDGGPHAGITPLQMAMQQGQGAAARLLEGLVL